MIRLLRHDDTVHREDDGAVRFDDLAALSKAKFASASQWSIEAWDHLRGSRRRTEEKVSVLLEPKFFKTYLVFQSDPGKSRGTPVDPALRDNVLLPNDFADYIYHIGNAHDMHSIIQGGLILGGRSLKRDRQSVFFFCTAVNPRYTHQHQEEVQYDLGKPRITVYKNTWRVHKNTVFWCNLKLAQRKGLQFYQTRSHAIALFNALLAICVEKVFFMKAGEGFFFFAKFSNPQGYRESYSRQICNMDVRILPTPSREHPPTIKANKTRSTRTHVASIPKKITERSTRKLVAVTLITEIKTWTICTAVHLLQSTRNAEESRQAQKLLQEHSGQTE